LHFIQLKNSLRSSLTKLNFQEIFSWRYQNSVVYPACPGLPASSIKPSESVPSDPCHRCSADITPAGHFALHFLAPQAPPFNAFIIRHLRWNQRTSNPSALFHAQYNLVGLSLLDPKLMAPSSLLVSTPRQPLGNKLWPQHSPCDGSKPLPAY